MQTTMYNSLLLNAVPNNHKRYNFTICSFSNFLNANIFCINDRLKDLKDFIFFLSKNQTGTELRKDEQSMKRKHSTSTQIDLSMKIKTQNEQKRFLQM
jgi:hypothetical protein